MCIYSLYLQFCLLDGFVVCLCRTIDLGFFDCFIRLIGATRCLTVDAVVKDVFFVCTCTQDRIANREFSIHYFLELIVSCPKVENNSLFISV